MARTKPLSPANIEQLLPTLYHGGVKFIVIGGAAGIAYGLARLTQDVDVVYARDDANIERLVATVAPLEPYLRDAPPGLPFRFDEATIRLGMNFTLTTKLGNLDLLGQVTGGGLYEDILPHTEIQTSFGLPIRYVTLDYLIHLKRAAGRPKDFEMIAELEALRDERKNMDS
jgi:predicted nucleotidyltransferase